MAEYVIPAISTIVVAIVGAMSTVDFRRRRKQAERDESRVKIRMEESRLSMEMMSASISLGLATATAIEKNKVNGEMHAARERAMKAQESYTEFLKHITSRQVAKF